MNELFCKDFLDYFPTYTELKDLRLTFITNCIFNNFITHTSIMLNIVTIYAIHKTSAKNFENSAAESCILGPCCWFV